MKRWWFAAVLAAAVVVPVRVGAQQAPSPFDHDPQLETMLEDVDTLSLEMLEREALSRNPDFAAMRAAAAEARARARVAGSLEDPMVDVAAAPRSFADDAMGPAYRWSIRQRLPVFGERGLERRSARAEAAAATLDAETARLDLLEMVREAFFDLYRVARALETNADQVRLVNQFRRVALIRYSSGLAGQEDPLQADAELGMLAHQEASLFRARRMAAIHLNTLLRRDPSLSFPPPPRTLELPPLADTARASLAARAPWPELKASTARVQAGESRASLASRRRLPQLVVGFQRDFFMREPDFRSMAMVGFNLPIGTGRNAAAEAEARASLARAQAERAAVADRLARRIEEARVDYEEALHEIEVIEQILVPTSERALAATQSGYEAGRGSFLAQIDAARRRADAYLALEEARARTARGWAALQRAVAADAVVLRGSENESPATPGGKEESR